MVLYNQQFYTSQTPLGNPTLMDAWPAFDADLPSKLIFPAKDLQTLYNCRLYLQVTTLAKISYHTGTKTLEEIFTHGQQTPSLHTISQSLFQWPTQPNPGKQAWRLWIRTIQALYTKPGMTTHLKHKLGPWHPFGHRSLEMAYNLSTNNTRHYYQSARTTNPKILPTTQTEPIPTTNKQPQPNLQPQTTQ